MMKTRLPISRIHLGFAGFMASLLLASDAGAELRVGIVARDLEPRIGIPLAGYGAKSRRLPSPDFKRKHPDSFFFKPSEGVHTPIRAKAMLLENEGTVVVFISLDTIGVEKAFVSDLARELRDTGIPESSLIVSGTHTHSGPGTLSRTLPLQLIATDLFRRTNYEDVLQKVANLVREADRLKAPADLYSTSFRTQGIQKNKFRRRDEEHFDPQARLLFARTRGPKPNFLGGIVNYAIHGGGMPVDHLHYSSDFPGQVELQLEKWIEEKNQAEQTEPGAPAVLFMNGAEGDVGTPTRGIAHIEELGEEFGSQARTALARNPWVPVHPELRIRRADVWLGIPGTPLKYCSDGFLRKSPVPLRVPLLNLFPQTTSVTVAQVGDISFLTYPGEPSTTLGFRLRALAQKLGHPDPWILGLTNDYMAYFTSREEYAEGAYDSCSSLFNWRGAQRIEKKFRKLLSP